MSKHYFTQEEMNDQVKLLEKYLTNSEEYKTQGLKIIASYCKKLILSNKGVKRGLDLMEKWDNGEKLSRIELFDLYILGPEAKLVTGGMGVYENMSKIYKELYDRYKPEGEYLKSWIYETLYPDNYLEANPNFTKDLNQAVENYVDKRPNLRAIFFSIDIHIMRD
jgi:hypothetical protein